MLNKQTNKQQHRIHIPNEIKQHFVGTNLPELLVLRIWISDINNTTKLKTKAKTKTEIKISRPKTKKGQDNRKQEQDQDHSKATLRYFMHDTNLWVCSKSSICWRRLRSMVTWFMGACLYLQLCIRFYCASSYASALLAVIILFIRPSHACFVTKPNNALRTIW